MIAPPFFPRGNGPLVSILLPTRGKPDHLLSAVRSLWDLAYDKSNLEFIFKVDYDDVPTIDAINLMVRDIHPKVIMSPRGNGYPDMHIWVNQMCELAEGDWLFLMNDDARMGSSNWDAFIDAMVIGDGKWPGARELCLLVFSDVNNPYAREFVALRREVYKLLGHFSLAAYCDDWIWQVMNFCGCALRVPIYVKHYRSCTRNNVEEENLDSRDDVTITLPSMEVVKGRLEDANGIIDRMVWFSSNGD